MNLWPKQFILEHTGKKQYQQLVTNGLTERSQSIHDPIKRNLLQLFKQRHYLHTGRRLKCSRTMWHSLVSCILQCKAVIVIWMNSLHMKYSPSLLPTLTLESFTCQAQSLTYFNALSTLGNHSHPHALTAKSWMERSLSTVCLLIQWTHLMKMQVMFSSLTYRGSYRIHRGWILYGMDTYISDSLKESTRQKKGKIKRYST